MIKQAYDYGVKLAAPLQMPNFAVRIVQGAPYHAVHYMPDGYAIYELSYEHLDKNPESPYHPNNIVRSLQQVPARAWEWSGAPQKTASQFDGWANHAALNAGMATRDLRYMFDFPGEDTALGSAKKRLPRLVDDIYYGIMPPLMTGHKPEDFKHDTGTLGQWFMNGYNPWDHPAPDKTASIRITSRILPIIPRST